MGNPAAKKATILLVEDDAVISRLEEWRLCQLGYTVCARVTNAADALVQTKEKKPDLILLDINIEGEMDGIDLAGVLATQCDIPVIFLTSHAEEAILKRVKGTLQYGYIKKPFKDDDLRISIELALSKSRFINRLLMDNALYEMVLNHFPLGVIIMNNDGLITYINGSARSILGWQDPLGIASYWEVLKLVTGIPEKPLEDLLLRIKNEDSAVWLPQNTYLITPEGKRVPVSGNSASFYNENGVREGIILTLVALKGEKKYFRPRL